MRSSLRVGLALTIAILWAVGIPEAQEGVTKRDRRGPVTVAITLTSLPAIGTPIKLKVSMDTHSVTLDDIAFEEVVVLRTPAGPDLAPTAVEQVTGGGHHRQAVLVFPPLAQAGELRIVVKNVGGVAERSFVWELPPAR